MTRSFFENHLAERAGSAIRTFQSYALYVCVFGQDLASFGRNNLPSSSQQLWHAVGASIFYISFPVVETGGQETI